MGKDEPAKKILTEQKVFAFPKEQQDSGRANLFAPVKPQAN
jgi:hypothetical protein